MPVVSPVSTAAGRRTNDAIADDHPPAANPAQENNGNPPRVGVPHRPRPAAHGADLDGQPAPTALEHARPRVGLARLKGALAVAAAADGADIPGEKQQVGAYHVGQRKGLEADRVAANVPVAVVDQAAAGDAPAVLAAVVGGFVLFFRELGHARDQGASVAGDGAARDGPHGQPGRTAPVSHLAREVVEELLHGAVAAVRVDVQVEDALDAVHDVVCRHRCPEEHAAKDGRVSPRLLRSSLAPPPVLAVVVVEAKIVQQGSARRRAHARASTSVETADPESGGQVQRGVGIGACQVARQCQQRAERDETGLDMVGGDLEVNLQRLRRARQRDGKVLLVRPVNQHARLAPAHGCLLERPSAVHPAGSHMDILDGAHAPDEDNDLVCKRVNVGHVGDLQLFLLVLAVDLVHAQQIEPDVAGAHLVCGIHGIF